MYQVNNLSLIFFLFLQKYYHYLNIFFRLQVKKKKISPSGPLRATSSFLFMNYSMLYMFQFHVTLVLAKLLQFFCLKDPFMASFSWFGCFKYLLKYLVISQLSSQIIYKRRRLGKEKNGNFINEKKKEFTLSLTKEFS